MNYTIYHNPRCQKSRQTLKLLQKNGVEPEVILYLQTPINSKVLGEVVKNLGIEPIDLVRKKETHFKENFKNANPNETDWIKVMCENPKLMERPIVVRSDGAAVVGRPPENVLRII